MADDREKQTPQQTGGGNGVGSPSKKQGPKQTRARGTRRVGSRTTQQKNSEGEVPEQKGQKRVRSEQERKERHNEGCRKYRATRNAELKRLQDFEKEHLEAFGNLTPGELKAEVESLRDFKKEHREGFGNLTPGELKENLGKLGVTKESLEAISKRASSKGLRKVRRALEAEFSRYPQNGIKQETVCDKSGVTEEGLEDKEKRAFHSIEETEKFLLEDEGKEEPSAEGNEKLAKKMEEFEALIGCQSPTPGGPEAVMTEPINQDDLPVDDDCSWFNADQCLLDDGFISWFNNEQFNFQVQVQTPQSKPVLTDRVNEQNPIAPTGVTKAAADGKENAIGIMSMDQECTIKTSAAAGMYGGSKGTKPFAPRKGSGSRRTGLVGPAEKSGHQKEGKKVAAAGQFR